MRLSSRRASWPGTRSIRTIPADIKARVFSAALGIEQTDWRYLRDQLIESLTEAPVLATRPHRDTPSSTWSSS